MNDIEKEKEVYIPEKKTHSEEMMRVIENYRNSIDKEIYDFVQDVIHDREVLPITIGYLSDDQKTEISAVLPDKNLRFASRCTIDADAIRHIINRHGAEGKSDHSMADIKDIARMSYVFANFDVAIFEGNYSKRKYKLTDGTYAPHVTLKKRINGTFYIIEAVTDTKSNKSHIVSAYIC